MTLRGRAALTAVGQPRTESPPSCMGRGADFHRSGHRGRGSFHVNSAWNAQITVIDGPVAAPAAIHAGSMAAPVKNCILACYCCCYRLGLVGMAVHGHRIANRSDF